MSETQLSCGVCGGKHVPPSVAAGSLGDVLVCSGCKIHVHKNCGGGCGTVSPDGQWLCARCQAAGEATLCAMCYGLNASTKHLCLVKDRDGPLASWVHILCCRGGNMIDSYPFDETEPLPICKICESADFSMVRCSFSECTTIFHISCAWKKGWYLDVVDPPMSPIPMLSRENSKRLLDRNPRYTINGFCAIHETKPITQMRTSILEEESAAAASSLADFADDDGDNGYVDTPMVIEGECMRIFNYTFPCTTELLDGESKEKSLDLGNHIVWDGMLSKKDVDDYLNHNYQRIIDAGFNKATLYSLKFSDSFGKDVMEDILPKAGSQKASHVYAICSTSRVGEIDSSTPGTIMLIMPCHRIDAICNKTSYGQNKWSAFRKQFQLNGFDAVVVTIPRFSAYSDTDIELPVESRSATLSGNKRVSGSTVGSFQPAVSSALQALPASALPSKAIFPKTAEAGLKSSKIQKKAVRLPNPDDDELDRTLNGGLASSNGALASVGGSNRSMLPPSPRPQLQASMATAAASASASATRLQPPAASFNSSGNLAREVPAGAQFVRPSTPPKARSISAPAPLGSSSSSSATTARPLQVVNGGIHPQQHQQRDSNVKQNTNHVDDNYAEELSNDFGDNDNHYNDDDHQRQAQTPAAASQPLPPPPGTSGRLGNLNLPAWKTNPSLLAESTPNSAAAPANAPVPPPAVAREPIRGPPSSSPRLSASSSNGRPGPMMSFDDDDNDNGNHSSSGNRPLIVPQPQASSYGTNNSQFTRGPSEASNASRASSNSNDSRPLSSATTVNRTAPLGRGASLMSFDDDEEDTGNRNVSGNGRQQPAAAQSLPSNRGISENQYARGSSEVSNSSRATSNSNDGRPSTSSTIGDRSAPLGQGTLMSFDDDEDLNAHRSLQRSHSNDSSSSTNRDSHKGPRPPPRSMDGPSPRALPPVAPAGSNSSKQVGGGMCNPMFSFDEPDETEAGPPAAAAAASRSSSRGGRSSNSANCRDDRHRGRSDSRDSRDSRDRQRRSRSRSRSHRGRSGSGSSRSRSHSRSRSRSRRDRSRSHDRDRHHHHH